MVAYQALQESPKSVRYTKYNFDLRVEEFIDISGVEDNVFLADDTI